MEICRVKTFDKIVERERKSNKSLQFSRILGLNAESDGTCRTIKYSYFKTGRINFQYQNDWGATGAKVVYEAE